MIYIALHIVMVADVLFCTFEPSTLSVLDMMVKSDVYTCPTVLFTQRRSKQSRPRTDFSM